MIAERSKRPQEFQLAPISSSIGVVQFSLAPFSEKEALEWLNSVCAQVQGGGGSHTQPSLEDIAKAVCVKGYPAAQIGTSPKGQDLGEISAKEGEPTLNHANSKRYENESPKEGEIEEIAETTFLCQFLVDYPAVTADDTGRVLGPFKKGDVAELPREHAEMLIRRGHVRAVRIFFPHFDACYYELIFPIKRPKAKITTPTAMAAEFCPRL